MRAFTRERIAENWTKYCTNGKVTNYLRPLPPYDSQHILKEHTYALPSSHHINIQPIIQPNFTQNRPIYIN